MIALVPVKIIKHKKYLRQATTKIDKAHDDVIKWKHFPRNWPFVRGIHRSPLKSTHKGQWRGALMFSFICVWINDWVNNREADDLRRYRAHYDVIVMACAFSSGFYSDVAWLLIHWDWDKIVDIFQMTFSNPFRPYWMKGFQITTNLTVSSTKRSVQRQKPQMILTTVPLWGKSHQWPVGDADIILYLKSYVDTWKKGYPKKYINLYKWVNFDIEIVVAMCTYSALLLSARQQVVYKIWIVEQNIARYFIII